MFLSHLRVQGWREGSIETILVVHPLPPTVWKVSFMEIGNFCFHIVVETLVTTVTHSYREPGSSSI